MDITPEMIAALKDLRYFARVVPRERYAPDVDLRTAAAIDLLDNADLFAAIDDAAHEMEAAAQFAADATTPES
jgi:hypothetical protein